MKVRSLKILTTSLLFLALPAWAEGSPYLGTLSTLNVIVTLLFALCHVVGIVFMFLSVVYFRRYRQNPNETPLSRVLWTLILGVLIFFVPWVGSNLEIYKTMQQASEEVPSTLS